MNVFELTRALVDIESITDNEERVGNYLYDYLAPLAARYDGHVERMEVEPRRFNVFAQWGDRRSSRSPRTSTPCRRSSPRARTTSSSGAAAPATPRASSPRMIKAVEALLARGHARLRPAVRGRRGAQQRRRVQRRARRRAARATSSTASRPRTSWRSARKGALRYEVCATRHDGALRLSANWANRPSTSCSTRWTTSAASRCPTDELLGPQHAEHRHARRRPRAQRDPRRGQRRDHDPPGGRSAPTRKAALRARRDGRAEAARGARDSRRPAGTLSTAFATTVVAYTTDIPAFGGAWGEPFLHRPGHHSRRPHARRARAQSAALEAVRNLSTHGKAAADMHKAERESKSSRHSRRHRHGGPAFRQVPARPPVVRTDVAGRERPLGRQEVPGRHDVAPGRRDARDAWRT